MCEVTMRAYREQVHASQKRLVTMAVLLGKDSPCKSPRTDKGVQSRQWDGRAWSVGRV